jgi:hypothetical protein
MCPFVKISLNAECYWSPVTLLVHDHFLRTWNENKYQLNEKLYKMNHNKSLRYTLSTIFGHICVHL